MNDWRRVALPLSVGANVVLLGLLLSAGPNPTSSAPVRTAPTIASTNTSPSRAPAEPTRANPLDWSESLAQLRRAGVPSAIIATVVREKIAQEWTPREKELEQRYLNGEIDAKRLAEYHDERIAEEDAELRAALGDRYEAWDRESTVAGMYLGGLTPAPEQYEPLYRLQKAWLAELHALEVALRNGELDQLTFDQRHSAAEADYKQKLAAIIGPERVDQPATDTPAVQVRQDFARLNLSENQIRQLAAIEEKWSKLHGQLAQSLAEKGEVDAAYYGDLQAIDRARDEECRRILGDTAFDAWQNSTDSRFAALQHAASGLNLPPTLVDQVYGAMRAYDLAVTSFEHEAQIKSQQGESVDWGDVDRAIGTYTAQTAAALRHLLGDARFEALQKQQVLALRSAHEETRDPSARISLR